MDIDVSMLLVPAGVSLVVALVIQFLVKPWLKVKYKDENHEAYAAMLNTIAIVGGVVLGLLGAVALNWGSLTAGGLVTAGLVGLFGGAAAIGGAESLGNFQKARE